jgi:hypothetical protein
MAPLALLAALAGCAAPSTAPVSSPPAALALLCASPFTANATKTSLIDAFGAANVTDQIVPGPEGQDMKATVLFANDPHRRVEIAWGDGDAEAYPADIAIQGEESDWTGPHGLKLGMSLETVEKINGGAFTLSGFGWDYGGFATDWKGGALARDGQGCGASIRFDPAPNASGEGVSGDASFASDLPAMRAARATIARLSIGYPTRRAN